jgi:uncharacterized membrane-anchored protein YitT (DUF2179 family)
MHQFSQGQQTTPPLVRPRKSQLYSSKIKEIIEKKINSTFSVIDIDVKGGLYVQRSKYLIFISILFDQFVRHLSIDCKRKRYIQ